MDDKARSCSIRDRAGRSPQLAGLGRSPMAQRYAIADLDQAKLYLADPILGARLRQAVGLMTAQKNKSALAILGSPDDL